MQERIGSEVGSDMKLSMAEIRHKKIGQEHLSQAGSEAGAKKNKVSLQISLRTRHLNILTYIDIKFYCAISRNFFENLEYASSAQPRRI